MMTPRELGEGCLGRGSLRSVVVNHFYIDMAWIR